jgi:hypothetical protein
LNHLPRSVLMLLAVALAAAITGCGGATGGSKTTHTHAATTSLKKPKQRPGKY